MEEVCSGAAAVAAAKLEDGAADVVVVAVRGRAAGGASLMSKRSEGMTVLR